MDYLTTDESSLSKEMKNGEWPYLNKDLGDYYITKIPSTLENKNMYNFWHSLMFKSENNAITERHISLTDIVGVFAKDVEKLDFCIRISEMHLSDKAQCEILAKYRFPVDNVYMIIERKYPNTIHILSE